jgi:hypothetical protein
VANKTPNQQKSYTAGVDLSTHQWKGVSLSGAGTIGLQGATGLCVGVLQNKPRSGEAATVMQSGLTPAYADGSGTAIAVGDAVGPNAVGVFIKKVVGTDPNVLGIAEEPATSAGAIISVSLTRVTT